ncbi:Os09g0334900 [Oryza sativa Japonica Group]|uniref:Os09g0334900 protein n=1 Tax=Oryza sativa subsp. japonica TaxID=39947 RepID=A0A0P0XK95_ORYSJ|nr:hypothetical protein EE612_047072 [Oryza sativa]BAT07547.1 Os09g0334900 [Oryza sativa Japonica Group]
MDHVAGVQFAEQIEQALRKADELGDDDLRAALRRARNSPADTAFQLPLLQLPVEDPVHAGAAATQPEQQNAGRRLMCPELYRAAFSGSVDKLQELLVSPSGTAAEEQGRRHDGQCVLDETTAGLNTVLHLAASQGKIGLSHVEITRELLSWNSNLAKEPDESESTPLHYAASDGVREIISMLIQSMPSAMYIPDKEGLTPLHVAAKMGHLDVIQDMLKECPDSAELVDNEGRNILHLAIERGHEPVVSYILGDPSLAELFNEQDKKGNTPMHYAVKAGNPRLAILESRNIKLNIVNNEGQTPFDLASNTTGFLHMIGFLLRLSANGARFGAQRQDCISQWSSKNVKEWNEKTTKNLGIVAVLIATIALTAMFNVPGGYNSDGVANLRATTPYNAFLVLDTVAMASSVIATMLLTYGRGAARSSTAWICMSLIFLWMALMSMILAFMAAVVSGLDSTTTKYILWSIFVLPFAFLVALSFVWAVPAPTFTTLLLLPRALAGEDSGWTRRRIGRRFRSVGVYLLVLYLFWFLNAVAFFLTVYVVVNAI